jgi:hypothetical protein
MERRFSEVCVIAGGLMLSGLVVFCPIAHGHSIAARSELRTDWDYWKQFCYEFIAASSKVIVAMMDGWQESRGVAAEIAIAKELGIPVEYLEV